MIPRLVIHVETGPEALAETDPCVLRVRVDDEPDEGAELLAALDRCDGINTFIVRWHPLPAGGGYRIDYSDHYWTAVCGHHAAEFSDRDLSHVERLLDEHTEEWHQ